MRNAMVTVESVCLHCQCPLDDEHQQEAVFCGDDCADQFLQGLIDDADRNVAV